MAENAALRAVINELRGEIAELRRQLGLNSRNSSKPPSTDGLGKPAPKSLRRKSGRKPGGQPGHPGSTLALVDGVPDERIVRHEPAACGGCGAGLDDAPEVGVVRRQVFDLPPMRIDVTEHQLVTRRCGCGVSTCGPAPAGLSAPVQYGPRVTAIVLYLYVGQFLSKKRAAEALSQLFGTPLSHGTVAAMTQRAADRLTEFGQQVVERIADAPVAGFDETGFRVAGKLHWVHCARTEKYTLITCHPKRGVAAMNHAGVLPRFGGVAVHDAWAPYDTYADAAHQLCCAHALRELQAVTDTAAPGSEWCWASQAADALVATGGIGRRRRRRRQCRGRCRRPRRTSRTLPIRDSPRPGRDRRPDRANNEETPRPGTAADRPTGRLPAIHHQLRRPTRQQRQ
jgi:transposase